MVFLKDLRTLRKHIPTFHEVWNDIGGDMNENVRSLLCQEPDPDPCLDPLHRLVQYVYPIALLYWTNPDFE